MKVFMKNAYRMFFLLMAVTLFNCSDDDDNIPADTEAPVITLNGPAIVNLELGDPYTEQGATATDNVDGDLSADIVVGGDVVDVNTEGTYTITYNVSDEAGNAATEVTRTVIVSLGADTGAPVITLLGDASVTITEGDEYTDAGATATDDRDGDLTENIVVGGDEVDPATPGTYVITYNVSDAAGNPATEVTREVIVEEAPVIFDDGLLTNGDFEAGADPWLAGVGTDPAPVVTVDGNTYYSVTIESPNPDQPFLVNLSQKLALTAGESYILSFDAWSDRERTIIAGIGRSEGDFANVNETVAITATRSTYTITLGPIEFGEANNRVLFDNNGAAGLVNIDNVSLIVDDGSGPDTTPPVITLNGSSTINLAIGATFEDPGATATDNVDGDITANIQVGGDEVDTNTEGTYVITYNVSDAAGNAAAEVTRTVIVSQDGSPGNLVENGDFETGDGTAGWLFFQNGGTSAVDNTMSNGGGSASGKLTIAAPGNPALKQERKGAGSVQAGDIVQVQFDHIGSVTQPGAVFNVLLFGETNDGASFTHVFNPAPSLTDSWTTFTGTFTIPNGTDVSGGLSLLIEAVCGGDAGCSVSANVDNVSITLNP